TEERDRIALDAARRYPMTPQEARQILERADAIMRHYGVDAGAVMDWLVTGAAPRVEERIRAAIAEEREACARLAEEVGFEPVSTSQRRRLGIQIAGRMRARDAQRAGRRRHYVSTWRDHPTIAGHVMTICALTWQEPGVFVAAYDRWIKTQVYSYLDGLERVREFAAHGQPLPWEKEA